MSVSLSLLISRAVSFLRSNHLTLWAAVTCKLNKVQLVKTLMKTIKLYFTRYQQYYFNSSPSEDFFFVYVCVLGCAFHPMWLPILVKISWAMKGWPTRLWIAFYLMWIPQGQILPTEVRMTGINIYRKYVNVHKKKKVNPRLLSMVFKIWISCEVVIKGEAKNN